MIMCKVLEFWSNYWVSKMFSQGLIFFLSNTFQKNSFELYNFLSTAPQNAGEVFTKKILVRNNYAYETFFRIWVTKFWINLEWFAWVIISKNMQWSTKCWFTHHKMLVNLNKNSRKYKYLSENETYNNNRFCNWWANDTRNKECKRFQCSNYEKLKRSLVFWVF